MKRIFLYFLVVILAIPWVGCTPTSRSKSTAPIHWPTNGWQTSTPEAQGLDSAKLAEGLQAVRQQGLNLHSVLIIRNGKLVLRRLLLPLR